MATSLECIYGFYNSENGDRMYNAEDFCKIFDGVIQDGVFETIGDHFRVEQEDGTSHRCKVKTGKAWLNHTYTVRDEIDYLDFNLVTAATESRIDAVVIHIDLENRINTIKVVEGTQSTSPVKPPLTNNDDVKEYALAYITLKYSENSAVKNENIENNVGVNNNTDSTHPVLPYVLGAMQIMTPTDAVQQLEASILSWFDRMKGQLSIDAAAHLQEEIDDLIVVSTAPLTSASQLTNGKVYFQYEE